MYVFTNCYAFFLSEFTSILKIMAIQNKKGEDPIVTRSSMSSGASLEYHGIMSKIEDLSKNQDRVLEKLDKFSDALTDPNDGLFIRLKEVELSNKRIEEKVIAHIGDNDDTSKDNDDRITELEAKIVPLTGLIKWQEKLNKSALWLVSGVGTAFIGLLAKFIYDMWAAKHGMSK